MGALLHDMADEKHDLLVNWQTWRPTVAMFAHLNLFDAEQLEMMMCNLNVPVEQGKALQIAKFFRDKVLSRALPADGLSIDREIAIAIDEPKFREWLVVFSTFCETSRGFYVG